MHLIGGKKKKTNEQVIEEIILEQYNQYYRLAMSYVKAEADAFDIVQNGVYKALRSSHTLKQQEYAKTWVYRIILNEIFAFLRKPRHDSYEFLQETKGYEEASIEDNYEDIDLQKALDTLSEEEKAIVIMKYFEDKKLEEIADVLEENLSTVKSKLYRSMKKLKIHLEQ